MVALLMSWEPQYETMANRHQIPLRQLITAFLAAASRIGDDPAQLSISFTARAKQHYLAFIIEPKHTADDLFDVEFMLLDGGMGFHYACN